MSKDKADEINLLSASKRGDLARVRQLIKNGAKVNCRDDEGETPLMNAAKRGKLKVMKLLLDAGARRKAKNKDGKTALEVAVEHKKYKCADYLVSLEERIPKAYRRNQKRIDSCAQNATIAGRKQIRTVRLVLM